MYYVVCDTGQEYPRKYSILSVKDRTSWKTKRIAEKHAREYKAIHMRDCWVEEE